MSVLVISWILTLLAVFGLTYAHEVRGESQLIQLEIEHQQLRAWARSGVELAQALLEGTPRVDCAELGSMGPENPLARPLACGEGHFAVGQNVGKNSKEFWIPGIADEAGRLPVALADSISLASLPGMTDAGMSLILAARTAAGESGFPPIGLLAGLDDGSRNCAERHLSRYGDSVNVNSASLEVLIAVGLPTRIAEKILNWREGSDGLVGTTDDRLFRSLESNDPGIAACLLNSEEAALLAYLGGSGRLSVESRYFSFAARGGGPGFRGICEIQVVLEKLEGGTIKVVEWKENWLN